MKDLKHISKFLSLVLRHKPEEIGITMDSNGWVNVDELIEKCNTHRQKLDFETLEEIVITSDKQRFAFNDEYTKIRANQGHTVNVDLEFEITKPIEFLYHGTVEKFIESIKTNGLQKMQRLHVHLSKDKETAIKVGSRRGKPVILKIKALEMFKDGHEFYLSKNGVWLCNEVPEKYIEF
ncbi:MAG: RNA 2'-phosphotransferase [Bacteroidota bacterium]|nr:RNA 2'-phosphotransferase [Bacteroidota bacterium]